MRFHLNFLVLSLLCVPMASHAQTEPAATNILNKEAVDFARFELDDNAKVEWIRKSGNLSGKGPGSPAGQPAVTGWVEYDFSVTNEGWYGLSVQPGAGGHEFVVDGKDCDYAGGAKVSNLWLGAGKHTLRIQRDYWTGFAPITSWKLTPAGADPADRILVRTPHRWKVIRKGETLPVTVSYGNLAAPVKLSLLVREQAKPDVLQTIPVTLPAGGGFQEMKVEIPSGKQGFYRIGYQINDVNIHPAVLPSIQFGVVDTSPVAPSDGKVEKRLVAEIDLSKQAPDYFKGGETRVVSKPFGSYRESGDVGYLQKMNSIDPSWFAYKFQVDDPEALYWLEFDYPDDARRTFLVIPRSGNALMYAGPATGPDSGREYSLTNRMQTMGIYFWPHDTDLRAAVIQPQSGLRAAVSKIRIYKVKGDFAPLPHAKNGRDFIHWYEEGSSFLGFFGAGNKNPESVIPSSDNWARVMSHMGASILLPTVSIYQMGMYPSAYNPFSGDFDAVRVIELMCEKYGLKFAAEFHTEARDLSTVTAQAKTPDSIYQFNRMGKVAAGADGPRFNFLNPSVEGFVLGIIGEFADRYGDSPAFEGVSIRLMEWVNTGFGNFSSLNWGYGDFTIRLFEQDTQIKIPVSEEDPERFGKRYQWLMANAKPQWIAWRCAKATELFAKVSARIRQKHPQAKLFLNDFLSPNPATSQSWYEGFPNTLKDAGIDPAELAKVQGVELILSTVNYGRRTSEAVAQRVRDSLLNPDFLGVTKQEGKPMRFMTTQAYFEATPVVAPPKDMGYPEKTRHGWMSGCVNPAGRHYLERFALPLAEYDAASLGDGGNGYTIGQPLLQEFLREYRALPQEKFQARKEARDPVAVWERQGAGDFLFYAVNRERYPVKVEIQFSSAPSLKRLATGESVPVKDKTLQMELQPYELRTFSAGAGTKIEAVTETVPEVDLDRVRKMTEWLRRLADDVTAGKTGETLTPEQRALLGRASAEAETCLKEGRTWRARTLQEDQRLREIYSKCERIPSLLDQNGPLKIPEGALYDTVMFSKVTSKSAALVASEKVAPELAAQQLVVSPEGELTFRIEVPMDGKYQIQFGQVVGEGFPSSTVKVDGKEVGVLPSRPESVHLILSVLPRAVSLTKGPHQLSLVPTGSNKRQALLFLQLTPVYQDIVANRWMIAGPFEATAAAGQGPDAAIVDAMKNKAFPPEAARDFSSVPEASGKPWKWQRLGGQEDYIDFEKLTGQRNGSIHYAVTYIVSPVERDVAVSFSSDYFTRMWINDAVVQDFYRPGGHPEKGQLKMDLHLKKGVNELLLKVGSGAGGNGFWLAVNNPGDLRFAPMTSPQLSESDTEKAP